jgi:uncharacterized protein
MNNSIKKLKLSFISLNIYRNLLYDGVIQKLHTFVDYISNDNFDIYFAINLYNEFYFELGKRSENMNFKEYIIDKLIFDENVFSRASEINGFNGLDYFIISSVINDLKNLQFTSEFSPSLIKQHLIKSF